ncbi:MAG: PASTA domain-containing protein, partial [Planctomycetota bacterium]
MADLGSAILEISGEPNIVIAGDLTGGYSSGAWFEAHVLGGTVSVGGCFQVGNEGSGLIEISGGTVECRTLKLQVRADESSGTLDVSGGRVHIHETLQVNDGNGLATMNMRGGQVNAGQLELARGSGSGTLKVTGGLLWVGGALAAPANGNGTATILLDDGTVECSWFTHAAGYIMDINEGILIIGGDARETILEDVNAGYIRPRHSIGEILVDYNNINAGRTTVWAAPHLEAVPDVIGLTLGAAETKLSQVGLVVGALAEEYDDFAPAGTVTSQDPNAGAVIPMGSSVNVVVSLGRPIVPNVVAKSLTDANTAIVSVDNLKVGTIIWQYNDDVAPSVVISQEPVGETPVPIGSTVDLVLSLGQPAVPNVTKLPEAEAVATIESIDNLTATVSYAHHDTVEEGHVISQSPAGGKAVPIGSNVGIVVSLGRPVVPNVIGRTQAYAATAIEAVSLVVGTVTWQFSDTVTTGIVLSQFPVGGTTVPVGQHVNLVVSLGRPAVPNVVGLSQFNATTMIKSVDNLSVGTVSQQYSNTVPSGDVIDQNPADGTRVLIGSTVDLIVSLGRPVVPHVCGWFEAEAVAAI